MENDYLSLQQVEFMLGEKKLEQKPDLKKCFKNKIGSIVDVELDRQKKREVIKSLKFYLNIIHKMQEQYGYDDNKDLIENSPYPTKPYQNSGSICFFYYVKAGDLENVHKLLEKNPFFVYEYDEFRQTCLHIAIRKENQKLVELILHYKPDVNFKDNLYRSPLYHALQSKNVQLTLILFINGAQPWSTTNCDYGQMEINERQKLILKKARVLSISTMLSTNQSDKVQTFKMLLN